MLTAALPVALCGGAASEARLARHPLVVANQRTTLRDALSPANVAAVVASDGSTEARLAIDGRDDTAWVGGADATHWTWTSRFVSPAHVALLRARVGTSTTRGVPVSYRWEALAAPVEGTCAPTESPDDAWVPLEGAAQGFDPKSATPAQPTHRSWFVDAFACGLRFVVDATNDGPPVLREVHALEGARDLLRAGEASADATLDGFDPADAVDGTYARRWVGAPGRSKWTLRVDLPAPARVDRVRLVLGLDATSFPRATAGRSYALPWAPLRYSLETSEDGTRFEPVATEPRRPDGSVLPLRRRLVTISAPRDVRAVRLEIEGATGADGRPDPGAVPVVREMSAYSADDRSPVLAEPWFLSVNANPSGQTHVRSGGELANDFRYAKFVQARFAPFLPALQGDDLDARWRSAEQEPVDASSLDHAGEALESIEGDDPQLDALLLANSAPPPVVVLSGSNDWDYGAVAGPDASAPRRWHWNPLRDARSGGMGGLAAAVRQRVAAFLGFCGGAQILGLLEADPRDGVDLGADEGLIDEVLRRTTGDPIRGFAAPTALERAWPGDARPTRAAVAFDGRDPLFADVAGPLGRSSTRALPLCHTDALRSDAFLPGGPLDRFELLATSSFCGRDVLPASSLDALSASPDGVGLCRVIPQAFRSRDPAWPIIAAQFHPEQRDFTTAAPGDPPESIADPRLFLAAAYELVVDAYVKFAP